jgi:CubicO group peptidase (beta-lactamase class C family)
MPGLDPQSLRRVAAHWQGWIDSGRIVGGVLLVAQNGELRYASARGWADREQRLPMQRDTRLRLASLTKLLTSITALRLCELGTLALDEPVCLWLPEFRPRLVDGRRPVISLRHLLSHTAGLGYGFELAPGNAYHRAGVSDGLDTPRHGLAENLRRLTGVPLLFEPGTAWRYSLATDVVGAIIEHVTGEPLGSAVARWVTGPLDMTLTGFPGEPNAAGGADVAVAYKDTAQRIGDQDVMTLDRGEARVSSGRAFDFHAYPSGGAGMLGAAQDYLRLLECLRLGGRPILHPETTERLVTNAIGEVAMRGRGPGWKFGLGAAVLVDPCLAGQRQGAGTWSWCGLYGSHYWVDPAAGISLLAMTNTAVAGAWGPFADGLVEAIYPAGG